MKQARNVVPKAVRRKEDFVYVVSTNVYDALADAVSENKASGLYYIEGDSLRFQGVEVYKADGASDDTIGAIHTVSITRVFPTEGGQTNILLACGENAPDDSVFVGNPSLSVIFVPQAYGDTITDMPLPSAGADVSYDSTGKPLLQLPTAAP